MATLLFDASRSDASCVKERMLIAGRYQIEGVIGSGGFGTVFRAVHVGTGQKIAVKVLSSGPSDRDTGVALRRFFLEARTTASLQHPNTVRVFDFGQEDSGIVYIAMELLRGRTLRQALEERVASGQVFSEAEATEIGVAVARGLAEAHAAGLVHRDLKPENIFLHELAGGECVTKVLDFGIVKTLGGPQLTRTSAVIGTPAYMSPEQARSAPLDGRSDVYSLGVILFQLVSGVPPFTADTPVQLLYKHVSASPPDLASCARTPLSDRFVRTVRRALVKDPDQRFPDIASFRAALADDTSVRAGAPAPAEVAEAGATFTTATFGGTMNPVLDSKPRSKVAVALIVLGISAALAGAAIWLSPSPKPIVAPVIEQTTTPPVEASPPPVVHEEELKTAKPVPTPKARPRTRARTTKALPRESNPFHDP
jgi:serine/threonine-protein kinase